MSTPDVEFIPLEESDLEIVREWRNSPKVAAYMYSSEEITEDAQKSWYARISNDPTCKYWIIQYDGKIGVANITGINRVLNSCYWAFYLGDDTIRGGGIGSKIEFKMLEYVFMDLELNKLRCEVFTFNDMVTTMHEKFGFRREAYYRQHCLKDGKYLDAVGLAMLKDEWLRLRDYMKIKIYGTGV